MERTPDSSRSTSPENGENEDSNRPRKYTIRNQRQAWTQEEHARFVEGIRLYKRNWAHVTAHVGTRTVVQIRRCAPYVNCLFRRIGCLPVSFCPVCSLSMPLAVLPTFL
jgi:hypothetical protein